MATTRATELGHNFARAFRSPGCARLFRNVGLFYGFRRDVLVFVFGFFCAEFAALPAVLGARRASDRRGGRHISSDVIVGRRLAQAEALLHVRAPTRVRFQVEPAFSKLS
jgi:hypothetical protein